MLLLLEFTTCTVMLSPLSDGKTCSSSSYCSCCVVHQHAAPCVAAASLEANCSFKDARKQRFEHKRGANDFKGEEPNQQVKVQTEGADGEVSRTHQPAPPHPPDLG